MIMYSAVKKLLTEPLALAGCLTVALVELSLRKELCRLNHYRNKHSSSISLEILRQHTP